GRPPTSSSAAPSESPRGSSSTPTWRASRAGSGGRVTKTPCGSSGTSWPCCPAPAGSSPRSRWCCTDATCAWRAGRAAPPASSVRDVRPAGCGRLLPVHLGVVVEVDLQAHALRLAQRLLEQPPFAVTAEEGADPPALAADDRDPGNEQHGPGQ